MTRGLWWLAGLILAMAATFSIYVYGSLNRYQVFEGEYVRNAVFETPGGDWGFDLADVQYPTHWQGLRGGGDIRYDNGTIIIENANPKRRVALFQIIDLDGQYQFELSAKVSTTAVVKGPKPWHGARLDFSGLLQEGPRAGERDHSRFHALFDGAGTLVEREVKGFFDIDPNLTTAQLTMQVSQATGRFTLSDISLKPAAFDPFFLTMDKIARSIWFGFVAIIGVILWRGAAHRPAALGAIALAGLGAALVLIPGFRDWLGETFPLGGGSEWTSRAMHFIVFATLTFLVSLARRRERPRQLLPLLLAMALGSEALQIVSGGLGLDDLIDLCINTAGVIVGSGIAEEHIKVNYGRRKRRRRKKIEVDQDDYQLKQA